VQENCDDKSEQESGESEKQEIEKNVENENEKTN